MPHLDFALDPAPTPMAIRVYFTFRAMPSGRRYCKLDPNRSFAVSPLYETAVDRVLTLVAQPRERGDVAFTARAIRRRLNIDTGRMWFCLNLAAAQLEVGGAVSAVAPPVTVACRGCGQVNNGARGRCFACLRTLSEATPPVSAWEHCGRHHSPYTRVCIMCGTRQPDRAWRCAGCAYTNGTHHAPCGSCGRHCPGNGTRPTLSLRADQPPAPPRPPSVHHAAAPALFLRAEGEAEASGLPYYGVELEIDDTRRMNCDQLAVTAMAAPLFYCKGDGSLTHGVELVSFPSTELWWREKQTLIVALLKQLRQHSWQSHDAGTCGMHIHISRTAFHGSLHLYRFLSLVYRSPKLSLTISQRSPDRLAQWARLDPRARKHLKNKVGLGYQDPHRYEAVNMTAHTAEVRLFRGTLNPTRFFKNLEFVWAAFRFTRDTERIRSCTAKGFVPWVTDRADQYPALVSFLGETDFSPQKGFFPDVSRNSKSLSLGDDIAPTVHPTTQTAERA